MAEVIKRLRKDRLAPKEYQFVSDMPLYEAYYLNQQLEIEEKAKEADKKAKKKLLLVEQKLQVEEEKNAIMLEKRLKGIEKLLQRGDDIASIADLLDLSMDETMALVEEIKHKKS